MIGALLTRELTISFRRGGIHVLVVGQSLLALGLVAAGERLAQQAVPWAPPTLGATTATAQSGPLGAIAASLDAALFVGQTIWLTLFCLVAVPAIAGATLARERERGMLRVLLGTGATPLAIVAAKLLAVVVQGGVLLLTGLPALGLALVFGSLNPALLAGGAALVLAWSAAVAALSVLCSTLSRSSVGGIGVALAAALGLFAATLAAPPLVAQLGLKAPDVAYRLNPLLAALSLQPELGRRLLEAVPGSPWLPPASPALPLGPPWLPFVVGCLGLALLLALLASAALSRTRA